MFTIDQNWCSRSPEYALKQGLDKVAIETDEMTQEELALDTHENVRGEDYYH